MVTKSIGIKVLILPLSLALVVIISILFIKPAFQSMNTNRKTLAENKEKLAALKTQTQKLDSIKSGFDSLEDKKIVFVALPENEDLENYMNELYQRASRSGILVSSFSVSQGASQETEAYSCSAQAIAQSAEPETTAAAPEISGSSPASAPTSCVKVAPVQISVEGSWEQLLSFYKYLTDSNRIANMNQVAIAPGSQTSAEGSVSDILKSEITLKLYYKTKSETGDKTTIDALIQGDGFNQSAFKKLKEIVYAPYEEPVVSDTGERNIFK
jgi:Tfp pilus assembly protein PilO